MNKIVWKKEEVDDEEQKNHILKGSFIASIFS